MGKRLAILILGMAAGLGGGAATAAEPIRIGWTAWPDVEFVTRLTARVIWKFSACDRRYLEDPKDMPDGCEGGHAMAHKGFCPANPEVAVMVSRMFIPVDQLQAAMDDARQTSYEEAVDRFVRGNGRMVDYWVTGKL